MNHPSSAKYRATTTLSLGYARPWWLGLGGSKWRHHIGLSTPVRLRSRLQIHLHVTAFYINTCTITIPYLKYVCTAHVHYRSSAGYCAVSCLLSCWLCSCKDNLLVPSVVRRHNWWPNCAYIIIRDVGIGSSPTWCFFCLWQVKSFSKFEYVYIYICLDIIIIVMWK